jgi:hypothetical protein
MRGPRCPDHSSRLRVTGLLLENAAVLSEGNWDVHRYVNHLATTRYHSARWYYVRRKVRLTRQKTKVFAQSDSKLLHVRHKSEVSRHVDECHSLRRGIDLLEVASCQ